MLCNLADEIITRERLPLTRDSALRAKSLLLSSNRPEKEGRAKGKSSLDDYKKTNPYSSLVFTMVFDDYPPN